MVSAAPSENAPRDRVVQDEHGKRERDDRRQQQIRRRARDFVFLHQLEHEGVGDDRRHDRAKRDERPMLQCAAVRLRSGRVSNVADASRPASARNERDPGLRRPWIKAAAQFAHQNRAQPIKGRRQRDQDQSARLARRRPDQTSSTRRRQRRSATPGPTQRAHALPKQQRREHHRRWRPKLHRHDHRRHLSRQFQPDRLNAKCSGPIHASIAKKSGHRPLGGGLIQPHREQHQHDEKRSPAIIIGGNASSRFSQGYCSRPR
jgi:hypothetical protein